MHMSTSPGLVQPQTSLAPDQPSPGLASSNILVQSQSLTSCVLCLARSLKFGRQSGADEESYGYGASGYDSYWKNISKAGQEKEEEEEEEEDEEEEEEEDDDDDDDEEEEEEEVVDNLAGLKLEGTVVTGDSH